MSRNTQLEHVQVSEKYLYVLDLIGTKIVANLDV